MMNTLTTPRILAEADRALLDFPLMIKDGVLTILGRTDVETDKLFKADVSQTQKQIIHLYLPTEKQLDDQDVAIFHIPVTSLLHTAYHNSKVRKHAADSEMADTGLRFQIVTATHVYIVDAPTRDVEVADKATKFRAHLAKAVSAFGRVSI
tara:strand:+ start:1159 stop:1611 length:453 start_codon:yes stop_codon:yes gene_type:complete